MKLLLSIFALVLTLLLLSGCDAILGEEIGRLPINEVSIDKDNLIMEEVSLDLKVGDEIAVWSDMDIAYEGDVGLEFKIDVLKDDEVFVSQSFDPRDKNITVGEVKTSLNGSTNWSFTGKNTELTMPEDAGYTFRSILVASDNPTLVVTKAELVIKK